VSEQDYATLYEQRAQLFISGFTADRVGTIPEAAALATVYALLAISLRLEGIGILAKALQDEANR
jgi:hypothetical protein